jgi:hypothetical protein
MCNKSIICGVLFASGAITLYEGNSMLSALQNIRYDNVTLSPLVLGEGYDSVPFNVMEQSTK